MNREFHIYQIGGGLIYSDSKFIWNDIAAAMASTFGCTPAEIGQSNRQITKNGDPVAHYG